MKISVFTRLFMTSAVVFLLAMGALMMEAMQTEDALYRGAQQRLRIYRLASELDRSTEDLTHMARGYVSTGNPSYKSRYFYTLDIRNGKRPRPAHYLPGGRERGTGGAAPQELAVPLSTLIRREGFTEAGLQLMREAEQSADALTRLDRQAIAAADGFYDDGHGSFSVSGRPDRAFANRLLHSARYRKLRDDTLAPIEQFLAMQNEAIKSEMHASIRNQRNWMQLMGAFIAAGLIAAAAVTRYARRRILRPLDELNRQAAGIAQGDYAARCEIRTANEIGEIGRNFNHMAASIEQDIAARKANEKLIWKQANFDSLTGLPNRHMLRDRLDLHIKKARRTGRAMALMYIDLDYFKEINDTLGHNMGDLLLKEAAQRLGACVRATDTVARLGGDEFTLILDELSSPECAARIAEEILQRLAEPFHLMGEIAYVTASIGITFYPEDAVTVEDLLKNADQAMYGAKNQGRNRYDYFTPSMQEAAQVRRRLAGDLRDAIAEGQFRVYYQPIVDMASGAIHKAEALVRWQHPSRGLISPAEFIPVAEESGLIVDIGDWVFREAARQAARWRVSHDAQFQISVNTSPVQYRNKGIDYSAWFDHLEALGLPGNSIVIEITEGLLMDASVAASNQLLRFRRAGIEISIDDFGTGYSSLSYLKKFHVDCLKIDQAFVRNIKPGSDDLALCEAMIGMAHRLGLKVVAEGIETKEQNDLLLASGCDYGQGYLYSRPLPAPEFDELLSLCTGLRHDSVDGLQAMPAPQLE